MYNTSGYYTIKYEPLLHGTSGATEQTRILNIQSFLFFSPWRSGRSITHWHHEGASQRQPRRRHGGEWVELRQHWHHLYATTPAFSPNSACDCVGCWVSCLACAGWRACCSLRPLLVWAMRTRTRPATTTPTTPSPSPRCRCENTEHWQLLNITDWCFVVVDVVTKLWTTTPSCPTGSACSPTMTCGRLRAHAPSPAPQRVPPSLRPPQFSCQA